MLTRILLQRAFSLHGRFSWNSFQRQRIADQPQFTSITMYRYLAATHSSSNVSLNATLNVSIAPGTGTYEERIATFVYR